MTLPIYINLSGILTFIYIYVCEYIYVNIYMYISKLSFHFPILGVCRSNPCQNGGICQLVNGQNRCICPKGLTGSTCEKRMFFMVPFLSSIFRFLYPFVV